MKIEYTTILTEKEENEVRENSARICWGFNEITIREQFKRYMSGDLKEKAKVCYLLEDCNYHTLCGLLADGKIEEAKRWIALEFPMDENTSEKEKKEDLKEIDEPQKPNNFSVGLAH